MNPYIRGITPKQAHVDLPDGLCEEEIGREGFFGRYAHLYRTEPPVGWTNIEGPLRPRLFDCARWKDANHDLLSAHRRLFQNQDVRIGFSLFAQPMHYSFRNADADELFFIHEGTGRIETDFGPMDYEPGDYLVIPRGTVYRAFPDVPSSALVVESASEFALPDKGMLGQHALFDPAVIKVPTPTLSSRLRRQQSYELRISRLGELTHVFYPFDPINAVGWKGTLCPWQLNVRDIRPVSCDRYHLPPSAHTTFVARGFVICSFLPRPLENGDPGALKVPFYHSNIDYDEVLFYHSGNFFSRTGVAPGMVTLHPQGLPHGPQPGAIERARAARHAEEVAIMIDTKRPLAVASQASEIESPDYWQSWQENRHE